MHGHTSPRKLVKSPHQIWRSHHHASQKHIVIQIIEFGVWVKKLMALPKKDLMRSMGWHYIYARLRKNPPSRRSQGELGSFPSFSSFLACQRMDLNSNFVSINIYSLPSSIALHYTSASSFNKSKCWVLMHQLSHFWTPLGAFIDFSILLLNYFFFLLILFIVSFLKNCSLSKSHPLDICGWIIEHFTH